jgi:hypothetical protein
VRWLLVVQSYLHLNRQWGLVRQWASKDGGKQVVEQVNGQVGMPLCGHAFSKQAGRK